MQADAHPPAAAERPEPPVHLPLRLLGRVQPPMRIPCQRRGEHVRVPVQGVCVRADAHPAGDVAVAADGAGAGGRDARLRARVYGMQAEGFGDDGVEEGELVDGTGGGQGVAFGVWFSTWRGEVDGWREREELGAERGLEGRSGGELVHEIRECHGGCFGAGDDLVHHFGCNDSGLFLRRDVGLRDPGGELVVDDSLGGVVVWGLGCPCRCCLA